MILRGKRDRAGRFFGAYRGGAHRSSEAFSLVEVTLALMVMAIGILTIVSLFPAGLDQNMRSISDTHAAFFAEEIFAGLRVKAETDWDNLSSFEPWVSARDMWDPVPDKIAATGVTNDAGNIMIKTNIYKNGDFEDYAVRYLLDFRTNALIKSATLWVWPGEYGGTNDPNIFYTEFFKWSP